MQIKLNVVIADESSYIKSHKAQRTKAALKLRNLAKRGYALSGTPILKGPMDLYSQMKFVYNQILPETFWAFRGKYAVMGGFENKQIVKYIDMPHLMKRLEPWCVSIKKEDVATNIPPKLYIRREIDLNEPERANYNMIKKNAVLAMQERDSIPLVNALAVMTKLMQSSSGFFYYESDLKRCIERVGYSKEDTVVEILNEIELPVIIWATFQEEQNSLIVRLRKSGYKTTGDAATFIEDETQEILVANPQKSGYGLNMQRASTAIFVSNNYRYGDREQAEARIHRIGQTKPVTIIDIVASKTIDNKVLNILKKKGDMANMICEEFKIDGNKLK